MSNDNYGFIFSIGTQEIYIGSTDDMVKKSEELDEDSEVLYDYTFNASKDHVVSLKEMYAIQHPNYKVIELLEATP